MATPLDANTLIDQAHKDTGVTSFDCDSYREGLDVFIEDFNDGIAKGLYMDSGIERVRGDCLKYLSDRLNDMVIAGGGDQAAGTISFRHRDGSQETGVSIEDAITKVRSAIDAKAQV